MRDALNKLTYGIAPHPSFLFIDAYKEFSWPFFDIMIKSYRRLAHVFDWGGGGSALLSEDSLVSDRDV